MQGQSLYWFAMRNQGSNDGAYLDTPNYHTFDIGGGNASAVLSLAAVQTLDGDADVVMAFESAVVRSGRGEVFVPFPWERIDRQTAMLWYDDFVRVTVRFHAYDGRGRGTMTVSYW